MFYKYTKRQEIKGIIWYRLFQFIEKWLEFWKVKKTLEEWACQFWLWGYQVAPHMGVAKGHYYDNLTELKERLKREKEHSKNHRSFAINEIMDKCTWKEARWKYVLDHLFVLR